jgi:hypothetical protein
MITNTRTQHYTLRITINLSHIWYTVYYILEIIYTRCLLHTLYSLKFLLQRKKYTMIWFHSIANTSLCIHTVYIRKIKYNYWNDLQISLRHEITPSILTVPMYQHLHPAIPSLCFQQYNIYPTINSLLTYLILIVHTICGHIFQLNSFTSPGAGPTGNIHHGPLKRRFWTTCTILKKLGIKVVPLEAIPMS